LQFFWKHVLNAIGSGSISSKPPTCAHCPISSPSAKLNT
jgi:hypothetical protein